jgi:glycosyltransferase involved in cell wall biosynthesis
MSDSLTISIAAYNEEAALESVLQNAVQVASQLTSDYQILVINDGSHDHTGEIAERIAKTNPHVRIHHHPQNLGFGITWQEAFQLPTSSWVFFIPGDGQIPAEELRKLWPYREKADFILGRRVDRQDPWPRLFSAYVYNLLISLIMKRRIYDVDSVALFRRDRLGPQPLTSRSVFIHAELCMNAVRSGARLLEVPIGHRARIGGVARGNKPGVIANTIREALRYAWQGRKLH